MIRSSFISIFYLLIFTFPIVHLSTFTCLSIFHLSLSFTFHLSPFISTLFSLSTSTFPISHLSTVAAFSFYIFQLSPLFLSILVFHLSPLSQAPRHILTYTAYVCSTWLARPHKLAPRLTKIIAKLTYHYMGRI